MSNKLFQTMNSNIIKEYLFKHNCSVLPPEDVIVHYIDSGYFVYFRRNFRRLFIADQKNPVARQTFKSNYAIRMEQNRHLRYFYCMIHPFSIGKSYWDAFFMVVLFLTLILTPIHAVALEFEKKTDFNFFAIMKVLCFLGIIDIVLTFFTGVYVHQTRRVVLDPKTVASKYLKGFFLSDLIASFPFGLIRRDQEKNSMNYKILSFLLYMRILRFPNLLININKFRDWQHHSHYKVKVIKLLLIFMLLVLWSSSIIYRVGYHGESSWFHEDELLRNIMLSILKAVYNIVHVGNDMNSSDKIGDVTISIVCLILGFIFHLFVIGQIMYLLEKYNKSKNKYSHLLQEIHQYSRYKQLPDSTRKRILQFYNFRYQKSFFNEQEIINNLSLQLRQDITMHTSKDLLDNVPYLRNLPISILVRLGNSIRSEFYLPNDMIFASGTEGDKMFLIVTGSVAIFTPDKREVCHLSDGDFFGEFAVVSKFQQRIVTVIAVDPIEVLVLTRNDFENALKDSPDLLLKIQSAANSEIEKILAEGENDIYYMFNHKPKVLK